MSNAEQKGSGTDMKISSELLYHFLEEKHAVTRYGRGFHKEELPLPLFFERGSNPEEGRVYIVRSSDLPQTCHTECLFLCVGSRPIQSFGYWAGEVFYIDERSLDVFSLSNMVFGFFDKISGWHSAMQKLLDEHAPVEEFVRASIPIFQNAITISDYDLRLLVNCSDIEENGQRKIVISQEFSRIPDAISLRFADMYKKQICMQEPFFFKGQMEDPDGENYCINLFLGDQYIGACSIRNRIRPLLQSDLLLFQQFAEYIRRVLSVQTHAASGTVITMKAIFSDLLQNFPVSSEDLAQAMTLLNKNLEIQKTAFSQWQCIVIRSANEGKTLPAGYLCSALEHALPLSTVVAHNGFLVCYRVIAQGKEDESDIQGLLMPYFRDMNFRGGVSVPFSNVFKAHEYYMQAKAILETGCRLAPEQTVYTFEAYALHYMLHQSTGEFDADMLLSPGLKRLRSCENSVDLWNTLHRYLDNECNASKTAQELYLHRSSLLPRLEKIRTMVHFDTPEQRLYLRMCFALCDGAARKA